MSEIAALPATRWRQPDYLPVGLFGQAYVLAFAPRPDGTGEIEPLSAFVTNPAGAAIVNAVRPIRQIVTGNDKGLRSYLVIVPGSAGELGRPVQVQAGN